jgi:hypothetical protein
MDNIQIGHVAGYKEGVQLCGVLARNSPDPTQSLLDSVRLPLDVGFVGLPAVPQDLSKL